MAKSQQRKNNQPAKAQRNNAPYLLVAPRFPIQLSPSFLAVITIQLFNYSTICLNLSKQVNISPSYRFP
jgi:hypothetical protein